MEHEGKGEEHEGKGEEHGGQSEGKEKIGELGAMPLSLNAFL